MKKLKVIQQYNDSFLKRQINTDEVFFESDLDFYQDLEFVYTIDGLNQIYVSKNRAKTLLDKKKVEYAEDYADYVTSLDLDFVALRHPPTKRRVKEPYLYKSLKPKRPAKRVTNKATKKWWEE